MKTRLSKFAALLILALFYQPSLSAQEKVSMLYELRTHDGQFPAIYFDWTEDGSFKETVGPDYVLYTYEQSSEKYGINGIRLSIYIGTQPFGIESSVTGKKFITEIVDFKAERAMWFKWEEAGADNVVLHKSTVYLMNVFPRPDSPPNTTMLVKITLTGALPKEMRRFEELMSSIRYKK